MERALELFEKLLAAKPDDTDRKRNVALCHKMLGTHFRQMGDLDLGLSHAAAAARLDAERVEAEPNNPQAKLDYTFDLSTIGDVHANKREFEEALRSYDPALALRRELWQADPANVYARDRLAFMLTLVARMHFLVGRHAQAAPLLKESITHARALPMQEAGQLATLSLDYLTLGEITAAAGKDPCLWYGPMADVLRKLPDQAKRDHLSTGAQKEFDSALLRAKTCPASAG
jgi:tetratricopeptide (TPR) repeat protein